jgi:hypothetical protein
VIDGRTDLFNADQNAAGVSGVLRHFGAPCVHSALGVCMSARGVYMSAFPPAMVNAMNRRRSVKLCKSSFPL